MGEAFPDECFKPSVLEKALKAFKEVPPRDSSDAIVRSD
jgi:hypothetical protein